MKYTLKNIISSGIPSYCTGNWIVIEFLIQIYKKINKHLLIECTANQVNQFGGYTGYTPKQFFEHVNALALKNGFPLDKLVLGGDHLGPLVWKNENESDAMDKAEDLVRYFVRAGYQKIHLDTSMRLGSDDKSVSLSREKIAKRGLRLYLACKDEQKKLNQNNEIIFVIGSEVPVPGGEVDCEGMEITSATDAKKTVDIYKKIFFEAGVSEEDWESDIVALVVQPGVEFGKDKAIRYNRNRAKELTGVKLKDGIVFEGHSTDYQFPKSLKEMVNDGIKILKVGPELTFSLRSSLERLELVEKKYGKFQEISNFGKILTEEMLKDSRYWNSYYDPEDLSLFDHSLLDRSRYYLTSENVLTAISKLRDNVKEIDDIGVLYKILPELISTDIDCHELIFEEIIRKNLKHIVDKYEAAFE